MTVVGLRKMKFTAQDGKEVEGTRIFCEYEDEHIDGHGTEAFFVTPRKFVNGVVPVVGDEIKVYYNKYGKVDSVDVVGY